MGGNNPGSVRKRESDGSLERILRNCAQSTEGRAPGSHQPPRRLYYERDLGKGSLKVVILNAISTILPRVGSDWTAADTCGAASRRISAPPATTSERSAAFAAVRFRCPVADPGKSQQRTSGCESAAHYPRWSDSEGLSSEVGYSAARNSDRSRTRERELARGEKRALAGARRPRHVFVWCWTAH